MDKYLRLPDTSNKIIKKFKYYKPYWCEELTELRNEYRDSEKDFKSFKGNKGRRNHIYWKFIEYHSKFDKVLRQKERAYNRGLAVDIKLVEINNPRHFFFNLSNLWVQSNINWLFLVRQK